MLSWLTSLEVTREKVSLAEVESCLLNSVSSRKFPVLLVTPMIFSWILKHWAMSLWSSLVGSEDLGILIFLFCPLNFSWI